MSDVDIEVNIDVECSGCRRALLSSFRDGTLRVDPCETCIKDARAEGRQEGREEIQE